MKKLFIFFVLIIGINNINAQSASVENSVSGVQIGFLGAWYHSEMKLTNLIALRGEIGLDTGLYGSNINEIDGFLLAPVLRLEPRWYYNLNKRERKSKRIDGNTGNFVSLNISYHPDIFTISSEDNINLISDISIIPTWGIRRSIGDHFNFETGIGIGYIRYLERTSFFNDDRNDVGLNLHLRFGYRF
jgi:hypothetical protein